MSTKPTSILRDALTQVFAGAGGFRLFEHGVEQAPEVSPLQGSGVVLWPMENTAHAVWRLLAALHGGIVPLLLPPGQPPARLASLRARFPGFGLLSADGIDWPDTPAELDPRICFGLLTSGSTGEPKAIVTSAERLTRGVLAIDQAQGLSNISASALLLPLAYSFACVNQLLWSVLMQRHLHLPGPLTDMAACIARIRASKADMLCLVPHQVPALLRLGLAAEPLDGIECVNFAGAPFPMAAFGELRAMFPNARLMNNYGCAEAMPRLCCTEVTSASASVSHVGRPIGDIALRITDGGTIQFSGSSTALGTLAPDGSLQSFGDWIPSGDLGALDDDGLQVLGRHDQVVKIGGERLSLLDVEHALSDFGAQQVLVWLEPGERVAAVVSLSEEVELRSLLQFLRGRLPRALLPATIFRTDHWPLNANHKTDRVLLQKRAREGALALVWPVAAAVA